jgi:hypothetical protein
MPNGPDVTVLMAEQIRNGMGFHPGNAEVAPIYERLRQDFIHLALLVNELVPNGRDKSLAIGHLEDALMRAIRAVALTQPLGEERR